MHATAFLKSPPANVGAIAVLFGEQDFLKRAAFECLCRLVLGEDDERLGLTRFAGDQVDLKTVCDELRTISMWGNSRLVMIDDADRFVSQNREGLEKYLQKPAKNSALVLDVKTLAQDHAAGEGRSEDRIGDRVCAAFRQRSRSLDRGNGQKRAWQIAQS